MATIRISRDTHDSHRRYLRAAVSTFAPTRLTQPLLMCLLVLGFPSLAGGLDDAQRAATRDRIFDRLERQAELAGPIGIIVELAGKDLPAFEPSHPSSHAGRERAAMRLASREAAIARTQERVARALPDGHDDTRRFRLLPLIAMKADRETIARLRRHPDVASVTEDLPHEPLLNSSRPLIGGDVARGAGYTGRGQAIAVVDTGVDTNHPFFAGRVLNAAEACFSATAPESGGSGVASTVTSLCPDLSPCTDGDGNDIPSSACGSGAGIDCRVHESCWHGTHVAGIALANDPGNYSGVAPDAALIPIQVFLLEGASLVAYTSDIVAALEHVLALSQTGEYDIAAVNMSLGGEVYTSTVGCDSESAAIKTAIDALRTAGIATVIAAGNSYNKTGISTPGCISSAISVGATYDNDAVTSFSNLSTALALFAPGASITSAFPGDRIATASGTSMATPHVAGAFALLRQKAEDRLLDASVDNLVSALRLSGTPIFYGSNAYSTPRIRLDKALDLVGEPLPVEVVVDSEISADVVIANGIFSSVESADAYGGRAYRGTGTTGTDALRFNVHLEPGYYEVFAWWPWLDSNSAQAQVTIESDGDPYTLSVDQTANGGRWNLLGTFRFGDTNPNPFVEISGAAADNTTIADALRFERTGTSLVPLAVISPILPVGYVDSFYRGQLNIRGGLPPYQTAITRDLPAGLAFHSATAAIEGVPTDSFLGLLDFVIQDSNGDRVNVAAALEIYQNDRPGEWVWVDDLVPGGGQTFGTKETWTWNSFEPLPFAGRFAHWSASVTGMHQHYFTGATDTLGVGANNDRLFAYVYLDAANPPQQVMLQWNDGASFEHRAYWGANLITAGTDGTASRYRVGDLPATGQWVRLEVPASAVGLAGKTLSGMAFTLYDGRAAWDYAGVTYDADGYTISGTVTLDGHPLVGVTFTGADCTVTDASGAYTCGVASGWSGTLTPAIAGYSFIPPSRAYNNVTANATAEDFAAEALASVDTVWIDDTIPAGATARGYVDSWNWLESNPNAYSGTLAHQSALASGLHQHYFTGASDTLGVGANNDRLFAYVYLDAANPPRQVMLQWNDGASFEHRAYWGANLIAVGTDGTASRYRVGDLPATGQWVRLEVPASTVDLAGKTLSGMAFTLYDGRAAWDYAGASYYTAGYTVSGTVTLGGSPLSGVAFTGAECTATDASGAYTCHVPADWSGTLTPTASGYSFTPTNRTYTHVTADATSQDFLAQGLASPDTVWVDDAPPAGASTRGYVDSWSWSSSNPSPYNGTLAHHSVLATGLHQHYFTGATDTLGVGANARLFAYVFLDAANPPRQVMLQWNDGASFEHRAYWGANLIAAGTDGTASRYRVGDLPATGQWVRLEVPASTVGLAGKTLSGMAFTLYDGRAAWDYAGLSGN